MQLQVKKRDGNLVPLDLSKFHAVVANACDGITGVSASEIELKSQIQFTNTIKTSAIQETLISAAANLISEETPNYQWVAGRLINYHIRKEVYGQYAPIDLLTHVKKLIKKKVYDKNILLMFTPTEFVELNKMIDHQRDYLLTYAAMEQFRGKYLVKDRTTGQIFETPQMAYILIAAVLFARYPRDTRMKWIKDYYDCISQHYITIPTPILAGVRTCEHSYTSCVLIECGDTLDSIIATSGGIIKHISAKAGLGIGPMSIRAEGDSVKNGIKKHTGVTPFFQLFQAAVKSCSQGGLRGGSATLNFLFFHLEIETMLALKNGKGTEDTSARKIDYVIQLNKLFYQRYISGQNITLFSPHDVPEVVKAFQSNSPDFEALYVAAEQSKVRKQVISAKHLMDMIVDERVGTGRLYIMNIDHVADHGQYDPTVAPVKMTNLCVEILGHTKPLTSDPTEGEIAVCILSALNVGKLETLEDFIRAAELAVRGTNAVIDYQQYLMPEAERATKKRRPIGIGIVNLAYWMAKNKMTYSTPNLEMLDEMVEMWSYSIIKASIEVAKEQGPCSGYADTRWSQGILPIDTYKKSVDQLVSRPLSMDWNQLRIDLADYGIANSTLMAFMPGESSSDIANATSGIDNIRALVTIKGSKDGVFNKVAPEFRRLKNVYEPLWEMQGMEGSLKVYAILQKYIDQAGSFNTSYNPGQYEGGVVPDGVIVKDLLTAYKYGIKNLYYNNTLAVASEGIEESCEGCSL